MLSKVTLQSFETRLKELKTQVLASLSGNSRGAHVVEWDPGRALRKTNLELDLKRINAALSRVERSSFGICCKCKDPIERQRLNDEPATPFCVDCADDLAVQKREAQR